MTNKLRFLITDGYPKENRDQFDDVGMRLAGRLYADMLLQYVPNAQCDMLCISDPGAVDPSLEEISNYDGLLWPGCNLTVYHDHDQRVQMMKRMVDHAYEAGIPQFGSCWGVQIAVYVAGGDVKANPKGREMGVARKVFLTEAGRCHPMYEGKAPVFDGLVSHDDEITRLPECATLLASNDFTSVQAVEVKYKNGIFWATQYHTEYDIHEIARLILAREQKLTKQGFFQSHEDLIRLVNELETLFTNPSRKDLRWRLAIDDDLLCDHIRQLEFVNWLKYFNFVKRTA